MRSAPTNRLRQVLVLASAALMSFSVTAQTDEPLEEVVATGQKMPRAVEDVQSSLFTLGADEIVDKELRNVTDTFRLAANVLDADWVDSGFVVRGVNSEGLTPGGSPLATLYIDNAPQTVQGSRRGTRGLFDVERVEIYRGPQSTLSGRSSLAGALYVFTQDPTFDWDAKAQVTGGSDALAEGAFAFGGPIVDDVLAFRVTAEYQSQENDLRYDDYERYTGFDDFVTNEYYQTRGKLLYQPEALDGGRLLLTYSRAHDSPTLDDVAGPGLGFEYDARRGDLNAGTPFYQENRSADNDNAVLDLSVPLGDSLTLNGILSRNSTTMKRPSINAGTPGEVFVAEGVEDQVFSTQELRLNYERDTLRWVAGVYLSDETAEGARTRRDFFSGGRFDMSSFDSDVESRALFGEVEIDLSERWTVIAGGRYHDEETRDATFFSRDYTDPGIPDTVNDNPVYESGNTEFLPKLGAVLNLANGHSLGLTYSEGFRSGGADVNASTGLPYSFEPEQLENYELAYRAAFADGRVRLAANLYTGDWSDQQVEVQLDPNDFSSAQTENAAKSTLSGFEVEIDARFSDTLSGFLALGRSNTEFESFDAGSVVDFSGLPFPQAPEWTASFGLDYAASNGVFAGVDLSIVDEYFARDYQNAPIDVVGDYELVNLRVGYRTPTWSVTLFADNATDEAYFVYRDVIGDFDCCGSLGSRRVVGVAGRWYLNPTR